MYVPLILHLRVNTFPIIKWIFVRFNLQFWSECCKIYRKYWRNVFCKWSWIYNWMDNVIQVVVCKELSNILYELINSIWPAMKPLWSVSCYWKKMNAKTLVQYDSSTNINTYYYIFHILILYVLLLYISYINTLHIMMYFTY